MPRSKKPELRFPIKLTLAQRKLVAEVAPAFVDHLKLDEPNQRIIEFTVAELKKLKETAETAIQKASTGYSRRPLRLVVKATDQAIAQSHKLPVPDTVYQFTLQPAPVARFPFRQQKTPSAPAAIGPHSDPTATAKT